MSTTPTQIEVESQPEPPADACLRPVLDALDWTGELRHLHEALPDGKIIADFDGLRGVLARLGYRTVMLDVPLADLDEGTLPAILVTPDDDVWVIMGQARPGTVEVFKGRLGHIATAKHADAVGTLYHVRLEETVASGREQGRFGWISGLLERERGTVRLLFFLAFIINCLALSLPVYLMTVFDMAIGARSMSTLITLGGAIAMIVAAEVILRETRARAIARMAVRTQMSVMSEVFEHLLRMPIAYIENASVGGQLNRLRAFESVRDIFSGPLAASLLDLPFILIFVVAVFVIGGSLGWLLVGFITLISLLVAISIPRARIRTFQAGQARSDARLFRMDLARNLSTVHDSGAEDFWAKRYRDLVARQMSIGMAAQEVSFTEQTLSQALSMMTGALIVGFGAMRVMDGTLSVGALVALMAIVWRVLSPIQTAFLNLNRVFQALDMAAQVNQLMQMPQESSGGKLRKFYRHVRGDVALENVAFRYGSQGLPTLRGVDLIVKAGEFVVIVGDPGSGRSTLLKLIANLYRPTLGRIRIDASDVRQFDVRELRRAIALVSEEQIIFADTLAYNLLLANPLASRDRMLAALRDADLTGFVEQLPNGLDQDLTELLQGGLSASIRQKIKLARAYLLSPSIYLFDRPDKDLDESGQAALLEKLTALKGKATVVVATSLKSIVVLADRVARLQAGQIAAARRASDRAGMPTPERITNLPVLTSDAKPA